MGSRRHSHRHSRRNRHQPLRRKMGTLCAVVGALGALSGVGMFVYGLLHDNEHLRFFGLIYVLGGCALLLIQRAVFHIGQMDA